MPNSYSYFYNRQLLATLLGPQKTQRLAWSSGRALANAIQERLNVFHHLLASDDHGSILNLDCRGIRRQTYSAYGYFRNGSPGADEPVAFKGYWIDARTRAYVLGRGHRLYTPILMRFTTADELSPFQDGGINAYAYCENDPVNFVDPEGAMKRANPLKGSVSASKKRRLSTDSSQPARPSSEASSPRRSSSPASPELILPDDFYDVLRSAGVSPASTANRASGSQPALIGTQPSASQPVARLQLPSGALRDFYAMAGLRALAPGNQMTVRQAMKHLYPELSTELIVARMRDLNAVTATIRSAHNEQKNSTRAANSTS